MALCYSLPRDVAEILVVSAFGMPSTTCDLPGKSSAAPLNREEQVTRPAHVAHEREADAAASGIARPRQRQAAAALARRQKVLGKRPGRCGHRQRRRRDCAPHALHAAVDLGLKLRATPPV